MICKSCGTEGRGSFCSHCGAALVNEAFTVVNHVNLNRAVDYNKVQEKSAVFQLEQQLQEAGEAPATFVKLQPQPPKAPAAAPLPVPAVAPEAAPEAVPEAPKKEKARCAGQPLVEIRLRRVFFPALIFFLPLLYLFLNAFVLYAPTLYTEVEGVTLLEALLLRLTDAAFASNPVSDVIAVTCGTDLPLWQEFTAIAALEGGNAALVAPAAVLVAVALACAVCGALVLLTAGRILRARPMADLVIFCGAVGSIAPLFADVAYRIYYVANGGLAAADAAMPGFTLSIEVMLLQALSLVLLLPAMRAIRRAAAGDRIYVTAPYRMLTKSCTVTRLVAFLVGTCAALLPFTLLLLPITENGTLLELCFDTAESLMANIGTLQGALSGGDALLLADAVVGIILLLILPLMLLSLVRCALKLLHLLVVSSRRVAAGKRRRRAFKALSRNLRSIPEQLLVGFVTAAVFTFLSLFLLTSLKAHINLSAIGDTLSLLYLTIAYAKAKVHLYSIGVLVAVTALALSVVAGNCARAFVYASVEAHRDAE